MKKNKQHTSLLVLCAKTLTEGEFVSEESHAVGRTVFPIPMEINEFFHEKRIKDFEF